MNFWRALAMGVLVALASTFTALWKVILAPPDFEPFYRDIMVQYSPIPQPYFGSGVPQPAFIVSNTFFLPFLVTSALPPTIGMRFYFSVSIFIGALALYLASLYFTRGSRHSVAVSAFLAYAFSLYPWVLYFDYWPNYYVVPTTLPLAFALADLASRHLKGVKAGAALALSASLSVSDPRSFIVVPVLIALYHLYVTRGKAVKELAFGFLFFVLLNLKTVISVVITKELTLGLAQSVANVQTFLLTENRPFWDVIRLNDVYKPEIFVAYRNLKLELQYTPFYTLELLLPALVFVLGGFLLHRAKWSPLKFFYFGSLIAALLLSSEVFVGVPVRVPLFNELQNNVGNIPFLNSWYWLFLPTYMVEYLDALFYVALAIVVAKALDNKYLMPPVVLALVLAFVPSVAVTAQSGSLFGNLGPYYISSHVAQAFEIIGNKPYVVVGPPYFEVDGKLVQGNTLLAGNIAGYDYNWSELNGKAFALLGIPFYLVVNTNVSNLNGFEKVYGYEGLTLYKSVYYNDSWVAKGVYLVYNYPYALDEVPDGYFAVPWFFPIKNFSGIVGNSTPAQGELLMLANQYSVDPLSLSESFSPYAKYYLMEVSYLNTYGTQLYELRDGFTLKLNDSYFFIAYLNSPKNPILATEMMFVYGNETKTVTVYIGYQTPPFINYTLIGPVNGNLTVIVNDTYPVPVLMVSVIPASAKPAPHDFTVFLYSKDLGTYSGKDVYYFSNWYFSYRPLSPVSYNVTAVTLTSFVGLATTTVVLRRELKEFARVVVQREYNF
ncbi:MAG: hypothetical protein ACP5HQ_08970 [Thermoprotei archaeon]